MYKDLSRTEQRRIRDAIYRLRKLGFNISDEVYSAVKKMSVSSNTQTYAQIEARTVRMPGVTYSSRKGRGVDVPGKEAYQALVAARKRNVERTQIQPEHKPAPSVTLPKAKIENIGSWEAPVNQQIKNFRKLARSFREPAKVAIQKRYQTGIDNFTKAIGVLVQNDTRLYNLIIEKVRGMQPHELGEWLKNNSNTLESILWKYPVDDDLLSYATVSAQSNIFTLFEILGINPDKEEPTQPLYHNLREQIMDKVAEGEHL